MDLEQKAQRHLNTRGFERNLLMKTMADYAVKPEDDGDKIRQIVSKYLENAEDMVTSGTGILLAGSTGVGKSMIVTILAKELLKLELVNPILVTGDDLIISTNAKWTKDKPEDMKFTFKQIQSAELLVVDDIPFTLSKSRSVFPILESIIAYRNANLLPTFVTYRGTGKELTRDAGSRLMSLMYERLLLVNMKEITDRRIENQRSIKAAFGVGGSND